MEHSNSKKMAASSIYRHSEHSLRSRVLTQNNGILNARVQSKGKVDSDAVIVVANYKETICSDSSGGSVAFKPSSLSSPLLFPAAKIVNATDTNEHGGSCVNPPYSIKELHKPPVKMQQKCILFSGRLVVRQHLPFSQGGL